MPSEVMYGKKFAVFSPFAEPVHEEVSARKVSEFAFVLVLVNVKVTSPLASVVATVAPV